ncbi:MAG: UDP-N-acetylglucosamine 2-epimerase (non-hydrolyzing) [Chloroflexota bacterium]|nr:UDP-N-acetylglucosamine 2-epimerase (non-hydrolyzing) [Chloroflexota bacterium]
MKILSIVGARPQFIKAAPVGRALAAAGLSEVLLHTGQHYDHKMSDVFFSELGINVPRYNLGIGSGQHGAQTGAMLAGIERVLLDEKPDWLLIYGDTNSTLAGALAAAKLLVPVAHVEAGLRSYNRAMPEETNRLVADRLSSLLLCPTEAAARNLALEGINAGVLIVGDVMYDQVLWAAERIGRARDVHASLGVKRGDYLLATVHRASNTDSPERLGSIVDALNSCGERVLFPLHPRTALALALFGLEVSRNVKIIEPVSYLEMLALERDARVVLTDSGGVQKEAFWLRVPCITMREETEWIETVESGWNRLVGTDVSKILEALREPPPVTDPPAVYGDGRASQRIAELLQRGADNV